MPKFYCSHCGQHIDADQSFSGTTVACPTCGGDTVVPGQQVAIYQQVEKTTRTPRKSSSNQANAGNEPTASHRSRALKATGIAWIIGIVNTLLLPQKSLGIVELISRGLGYALGAGLFAMIVSVIVAGVLCAFRKPFGEWLFRCYAAGVVLIALFGFVGGFVMRKKTTSLTAPSLQAVEKAGNIPVFNFGRRQHCERPHPTSQGMSVPS
jgi:hypothetical protein